MLTPHSKSSSQQWSHQDELGSQASEIMTQPEIMTQNELTQLAVDEETNMGSPIPMHAQEIQTINQPWGRLVPCSGDKRSGGLDLLPREPCDDKRTGGVSFIGLERLRPGDIFNEHTLGRSSKCDIMAKRPPADMKDQKILALHEWAHALISNTHCKIFSMLKLKGTLQDMEVYIEDTSGNGTLINGTTLLRRGEKRLLHTGDEISLLNPQSMQKKIRSPDLLHSLQRKHAFIFINVFQQQQGHSALMSCLHQKSTIMLPPPTLSSRRKGLVDPKATVNHSIDRFTLPRPFPVPQSTVNTKLSPTRSIQTLRVEELYDIRDVLGTGTVGEVRRAIHRRTGEERAVKIIALGGRNRGVKLSEEASGTLAAEASILQALDHPYVVKLYDVFVAPGVAIYLVMELLHGGDLFDRIVQKGKYSEMESRKVMRRLLSAVYYLHEEQNVVHRDLKPENILVVSQQSDIDIKLTDFGLAKSVTEDGLKTFCGTPQYFAPEVLRRQSTVAGRGRYGKQADMWSIGVILYILLSGAPPFDVSQGFDEIAEAKIVFPKKGWNGISKEAVDLVKKLLLADPTKRISVKDACTHEWILMPDGDSHTHPLGDPAIRSMTNDNNATLHIKMVMNGSAQKEMDVSPSIDDAVHSMNTARPDDLKITGDKRACGKQLTQVMNAKQRSPVISSEDFTAQDNSPCDQRYEEDVVQVKITVDGERRTPLDPVDLNHRSNYFRQLVANTANRESATSKRNTKAETCSVQIHDPNFSTKQDKSKSRAVTPATKRSGKRSRARQVKQTLEAKNSTELSDDEIYSQFTDEGDSISTFGQSVITENSSVDKTDESTIERRQSASSSLSDRESTLKGIEPSVVTVPLKKKSRTMGKVVTPEGEASYLESPLQEIKCDPLTVNKNQTNGKQTKLSCWLLKKSIT